MYFLASSNQGETAMWRSTRLALTALLIAAAFALPQLARAQAPLQVSLTTTTVSGYVRNLGLVTKEPSQHVDLFVQHESGFYFDLWHAWCFKNPNTCAANETDVTFGYAGALGSTGWRVDAGLDFINIVPLSRIGGGDMFDPFVELITPSRAWNLGGAHSTEAFLRVELYRNIAGKNWEATHVGLRDVWDFGAWRLNSKVFLVNYPTGYMRGGTLLLFEEFLSYPITERVRVGGWFKRVMIVDRAPDAHTGTAGGVRVTIAVF